MSDATSSFYMGLETLSLALIFMPEPATTVIGAGLLSYARQRRIKHQQRRTPPRRRNTFESYYSYRMQAAKNSVITLQFFPKSCGQLPLHSSKVTKIYYDPKVWQASQKAASTESRANHLHFSGIQPMGLMKRRNLVGRAGLYTDKHRLANR